MRGLYGESHVEHAIDAGISYEQQYKHVKDRLPFAVRMDNQFLQKSVGIGLVLRWKLLTHGLLILVDLSKLLAVFLNKDLFIDLHGDSLAVESPNLAEFEVVVGKALLLRLGLVLVLAQEVNVGVGGTLLALVVGGTLLAS